jgi:phosphoribosyl-dephospho-CoA transferase
MAMSSAHKDLERHMLVWLTGSGWHTAIAAAQEQHKAALMLWQSHDWPVVVRRADVDAAADEVCLGLPLPPKVDTGEKVRIALRARAADIAKVTPATVLQAALDSSGGWRDSLTALCNEGHTLGLRVFGSLAMQTLTGQAYISPTSDVDVLFHPASRQQLDEGFALLARYAKQLPLDGEIVFPCGAAVSWKEWQMATTHPAKVMVKELQSVRLASTESLLQTLAMPTAPATVATSTPLEAP